MIVPDEEFFRHPIINPRYLSKNYPEFFEYLKSRYTDISSISEALYMWRHNILKRPVCPICGSNVKFQGITKGYSLYCSYKCSNSSEIKKAKVKNTCTQKYGVSNPNQNSEIHNKVIKTCLEKYGVDNPSKSEQIKQHIRNKCIVETGYEYYSQVPEIKDKKTKTFRENHPGYDSPLQLPEASVNREKRRGKQMMEDHPDIIGYVQGHYKCMCPHPECTKCSDKFYIIKPTAYFDRKRNRTEPCTNILPFNSERGKNTSLEIFVRGILDEYNIKYETNVRDVIPPQELDIYIPDKHIAIECNGIYFHSTSLKPRGYHRDKFTACQNQGIQLLTIWEDWIINKPQIVKQIILSKLGIYKKRIYARQCEIREVSSKESNTLLEQNHIQGACSAHVRYGLYYKDELVATMAFGRNRNMVRGGTQNNWELVRFCCDGNMQIIGGANKMLSHFIKDYSPETIYSFSSNDISNGNLYERLGFIKEDINLSYWYINSKDGMRCHRSAFTKQSIIKRGWKTDKDGWKEVDVMREHGYYQIYDSGQTKWVYNI